MHPLVGLGGAFLAMYPFGRFGRRFLSDVPFAPFRRRFLSDVPFSSWAGFWPPGILVHLKLDSCILGRAGFDSGFLGPPGLDSLGWILAFWVGFWRPGGYYNRTTELTD